MAVESGIAWRSFGRGKRGIALWSDVLRQLNDVLDRRTKRQAVAAAAASIVIALLDTLAIALVLPLVNLAAGSGAEGGTTRFVSRILGDPKQASLTLILTALVVGLFILKDLAAIAFSWWLAGFKAVNGVNLSSRILRLYLTSPYTQVSGRSSSEMMRTMSDASAQVFGSVVYGVMNSVLNIVSMVAIVSVLLISAPGPALAAIVYFGLSAYLYMRVIKPKMSAAGATASDAARGAWRTAFAALGGLKELKVRGTQDHFIHQYEVQAMRGARASRLREMLGGLPRYLLEIIFMLAVGLILLTNMLTNQSGSTSGSVGVLALFVAAGFRVLPSITGLLGNISGIRYGAPFLQLVHAEVQAARKVGPESGYETPRVPFRNALRVEQVRFRYPTSSADALRGVSITVDRGRAVALVGGSGAGKTTLIDVILGLHEPAEGQVTVDGRDIQGRTRGWQANIGYVPQDVFLLDGTLAENIAFDQEPDVIDHALLRAVIAQAQLEELVAGLPNGMGTQIGENGSRLSGGQRQRVGIARALYRKPDLLVLDEATSSLDNETEHRINETIRRLRGSITVIVVAHRLSTVRDVDQVVFMKEGRIECVGTFDQVQRNNADFERLVRLGSLSPQELAVNDALVPEDVETAEPSVVDAGGSAHRVD